MWQRGMSTTVILAILALAIVVPQPAEARLWVSGTTTYAGIVRVCRDGAQVGAAIDPVFAESEGYGPDYTSSTTLDIRLYDRPNWLELERSGTPFDFPAQLTDFPRLVAPPVVPITYHEEPLRKDRNGDGVIDIEFNFYGLKTVTWSRLLDVGQKVIVEGPNIYLTLAAENCYFNRLTLNRGASAVISGTRLKVEDGLTNPANLVYRVDSLPARGTLRLNNTVLAVGSTFTQADINANRLRYTHNGSNTTSDSFRFSVAGTTRVSVSSGGGQGNNDSFAPAITWDGRFIAFESDASNLVSGDTNGERDVFRHDQVSNQTTRVSISSAGAQANGRSSGADMSHDGRMVVFESEATNLVANDTNDYRDIFVRDTEPLVNETRRVSLSLDGQQGNGNSFSASASFGGAGFVDVAFVSGATDLVPNDTNNVPDVFSRSGANFTQRISVGGGGAQANNASSAPAISANANAVAFASTATNLVAGDTNGFNDVFVRSLGQTVRVSVATNGAQANERSTNPAISSDGRFVAFQSLASNLVAGDTNAASDIFVRDRNTNNNDTFDEAGAVRTQRVSRSSEGGQANGGSFFPALTPGGRYVAFESDATNLVPGDTNGLRDIFVYDQATGLTVRASVAGNGAQANGNSFSPAISADGSYVAFSSNASNLVANDTNLSFDIFVRYMGFSSEFVIAINPAQNQPEEPRRTYLPMVVRRP